MNCLIILIGEVITDIGNRSTAASPLVWLSAVQQNSIRGFHGRGFSCSTSESNGRKIKPRTMSVFGGKHHITDFFVI